VRQLRAIVEPLGYIVDTCDIEGALHLKSACTRIDDETILANPQWIDLQQLGGETRAVCEWRRTTGRQRARDRRPRHRFRLLPGHARGPRAPRLQDRPGRCSELHKAEGGLTCLSLVF
jgi:dimethylargininase